MAKGMVKDCDYVTSQKLTALEVILQECKSSHNSIHYLSSKKRKTAKLCISKFSRTANFMHNNVVIAGIRLS